MTTSYTTKPRNVEAVYWDGRQLTSTPQWVIDGLMSPGNPDNTPGSMMRVADSIHIGVKGDFTLVLAPGNWLVLHDNGAFQILPDHDFKETYEPTPQHA